MDIARNQVLSTGNLELRLNPSIGGSICAFAWIAADGRRMPILRECHSDSKNVLEAANFPLVPFVNRIRGSKFTFRGREIVLSPNMDGDPSVLHGQGWLAKWDVVAASDDAAELRYAHPSGEWPWSYETRQSFALDDRGLSMRLTCRNTSGEVMPCGLGQHPYFPCGPETRIDTRVTHAWTIDENVLPGEKVPAVGSFDLQDRLACGQDLDHGFAGWGGSARMTDPEWPFDVELSSAQAHFFQVYSPASGGLFVAEPVSHANAALNEPEGEWETLGIRLLEPGEEMSLAIRLDVIAK